MNVIHDLHGKNGHFYYLLLLFLFLIIVDYNGVCSIDIDSFDHVFT